MSLSSLKKTVEGLKLADLAYTPKSKQELEGWVVAHTDPHVTTAYLMTYNFVVSQLQEELKRVRVKS